MGRAALVMMALLVGCQATTTSPSPSAANESSAPSASPTASLTDGGTVACASELIPPEDETLLSGTLAEVITDDLVMRTAPRIADDSQILSRRLGSGDIVYIEHGPIDADGYAWYLSTPDGADPARGWVAAASRDGEPWLRPLGAEGGWCILGSTPLPDGPSLRGATAGQDGRIYVFGGEEQGDAEIGAFGQRSWAYDTATNSWTELAPMPVAGWGHHSALASDGRLWVFSYASDAVAPDAMLDVQVYDPAADSWHAAAQVPYALMGPIMWAPDERLLALGWESITVFDPASGALDTLHGPRTTALTRSPDGAVYTLTSEGGFRLLDVDQLTVGPIRPARFARLDANAAALPDGRVVAVGGHPAGPCAVEPTPDIDLAGLPDAGMRLVDAFDPSSGSWTTLAPLPAGATSSYAVTVGDELYVLMHTSDGVMVARYLDGHDGLSDDRTVADGPRSCGG